MPALPLLPTPKATRMSSDDLLEHNNARQIFNNVMHPPILQRSPVSHDASTLEKRAFDHCTYYDSSCSRYRTIIIIIIILVILLKIVVIFLLFRRHQKKKARRAAESRRVQAEIDARMQMSYEAPPPEYYASTNATVDGPKYERAQGHQMDMPRIPEPAMSPEIRRHT